MNPILHTLPPLSATATAALFSAIWQGTILAGGVVLSLRLLPGLSPASRSAIWLNVFVLLALLHLVPAFTGSTAGGEGSTAPFEFDLRWSLAIAGLWATLSLWRATQLILGAIHLQRVARSATPIAVDAGLQTLLQTAPDGRIAELCVSDEIARPGVLGFFRPRILVPPALIQNLSTQELQQVVLHEMEHLRRADDWTNLLQKIALVLFPLNPVLLWVERRLCVERELACDDRVLLSNGQRKAYAICLTRLAEYSMVRRSLALVLGAWERRPELVRRVQRILRRPAESMNSKAAMAATTGLIVGALGCAIGLARSPQLVSFAPAALSAQQLQAASELGQANLQDMSRALGGKPQLMKAVMPQRPASAAYPVHATYKLQSLSQAMRASAPKHIARHRPAIEQAQISTQNLDQAEAQTQSTWIVLTEWTDAEALPARMVFAISQQGLRPSYAAVPVPNGWLIVQI